MRSNLPVSGRDFPLAPDETLVSTTDLKGRITYCNPAFIHVSGYTREELLGQPHNLVRHPDMPEEAFRDMWHTIASGRPWLGVVKNRRKDGDHYWVLANVTPLVENGRPVGYMSVRTCPSAEQVASTEKLYACMRSEAGSGRLVHRVQAGRVVRDTFVGRWQRRFEWSLGARLSTVMLLATLLGFGAGAASSGHAALALGGALLAASAAAAWLHRQTIAPLHRLLGFANRMAAGDLTERLPHQGHGLVGQLSQALNQLNVNMLAIVRDARTEVRNMCASTQEIASDNQDLSSRTESQAASLEETAASMEQITATVRQSAEAANNAARLAQGATEVTQRGSEAVLALTSTMEEIEASSRRIGEIIHVIEGIAFQTNMLALNAAVEAARAGAEGRGFAVVAGEVRALSQRTSTAAREVKTLIEDAAKQVHEGTRVGGLARSTIGDTLASVQQVGALVSQISRGAQEQLSGISQVNEAVAQLDGITQQNATLVEQLATSGLALRGQADILASSVEVFHLGGAGAAERAPADAVALRRRMKEHRPASALHAA
jgi:aerotaxis receptor